MSEQPVRYQSSDEDSGRWADFPFRDGDIVISTRSPYSLIGSGLVVRANPKTQRRGRPLRPDSGMVGRSAPTAA